MIVEDEVIVAEDLRRNLEAAGYEVVGQAVDGREAIQLAEELRPDLILMDVRLEGETTGIEAAKAITDKIDAGIIYVSAHSDDQVVDDAAKAGALAFIVKPFHLPQVISAIRVALRRRDEVRSLRGRQHKPGEAPPFTEMLQRVQTLLADETLWSSTENGTAARALSVTPREREVIRGLVAYRRLARVAEVLGISIHTARNHLKSVLRKLNLHSQDELLEYLLEREHHA
jgi:response regulator NasT